MQHDNGECPPRVAGFGDTRVEEAHDIPGIFVARVSGRGGCAVAALQRWRHLLGRAQQQGHDKLLVVHDMHGPSLAEDALPGLMRDLGVDLRGLRIALVQPSHERYRIDELGSLLAMEQGADARVFPDEPSALVWLRYGDS
jgi:hypothetical protein